MVEYSETFLNEMISLLLHFVEFSDNGSLLRKVYLDDCAVGGLDQRPIIMIKHDEIRFFANDRRRKVWTLDGNGILQPKRKGIMVSDFLLP